MIYFKKNYLLKFLLILSINTWALTPVEKEISYQLIKLIITNNLETDEYLKNKTYNLLSNKFNHQFPIKEKKIIITDLNNKRWIDNNLKGYLGAYFNTNDNIKPFAYSYVVQHSKESALKDFINNNDPEKIKKFNYFFLKNYFLMKDKIIGKIKVNEDLISFKLNYEIIDSYIYVNNIELVK